MSTRTPATYDPEQIQAYVAEAHRIRAEAFAALLARLFRRSATPAPAPAGRLAAA